MSMSMEEARDRCLGQDSCADCPFFMDTCDGNEEQWVFEKETNALIKGDE